MLDRDQLYNQLKQQAKDDIFAKQMAFQIEQRLGEVQADHKKVYSEKVKRSDYTSYEIRKPERFVIPGDDATLQPKMWQSLITDCAFYFENPTPRQEVKMRQTLQRKYDDLLPVNWRPALQSRQDLVSWACYQQNSFLKDKNAPEDQLWNCENPNALIAKFGPNYDVVKAKLGHIRALQRE